jgi:hypothetical protein
MEACGDQTSHICNCAFSRRISLSFWASGACFGGMLNTCACSLMCCRFVTFRKRGSDPQLAVDTTQRNPIGAIRVQPLRIAVGLPRGYMMSAPFRFETQESLAQELRNVTPSSRTFDRDLAVKIGSRVWPHVQQFGGLKQKLRIDALCACFIGSELVAIDIQ